jgi:hypothetical protein
MDFPRETPDPEPELVAASATEPVEES